MKARTSPDPLKIFMNAERFRIADLTLRSSQYQNVAVAVAGPALVLSAFASELYGHSRFAAIADLVEALGRSDESEEDFDARAAAFDHARDRG
jgi:hypothetical protein